MDNGKLMMMCGAAVLLFGFVVGDKSSPLFIIWTLIPLILIAIGYIWHRRGM